MEANISFTAKNAACSEALDFEIQQIEFEGTIPITEKYGDDIVEYFVPSFTISVNYEFSDHHHCEYYDGEEGNRGY